MDRGVEGQVLHGRILASWFRALPLGFPERTRPNYSRPPVSGASNHGPMGSPAPRVRPNRADRTAMQEQSHSFDMAMQDLTPFHAGFDRLR